jgi:subtilase family serine protease
MNPKVLAGLTGLALSFCPLSFGATLVWTNTGGGSWTNAANWSPNQIPSGADQAVVTNAGSYTVEIPATATVNGLTVGGGAGAQSVQQTGGTITLNGETRILSGGALTLVLSTHNAPITIDTGGSLVLNGGGLKSIFSAVTNRGVIQFGGQGDLYLYGNNGARVENAGLFEFLTDRSAFGINGNPAFRNTGTVRKSGGTATARLGFNGSYPVALENSGLIESQSGVLQLFGGGILAGQLVTATGAILEIVGGTWTQPAANVPVVSGAGICRFTGGTLNLVNTIPGLQLAGGTVVLLPSFQAGGAITNLTLDGAALSGTNVVIGTLRWRDGAISGFLTVEPGGLLIAEGTATKTWNAVITNRGTFQCADAGELYLYGSNGARMANEGLFEFLADRSLYGINGNPPFVSTGTIRKSAGTGVSRVGVSGSYPVALTNTGALEVQSGQLQFFGGGSLAGQLTTAAGAILDLVGGAWMQAGPAVPVVGGAGVARVSGGTLTLLNDIPNLQLAGGTVILQPTFQDGGSITNLVLEGATLNGTNMVTGTLRWRDGAISGVLTIASNGLLIAEGTATKTWNGAITNRGTFQCTGSGALYLFGNNGARLVNPGLFEFLGDLDLFGINGNPPVANTGVMRKSAGTGTARLGVAGSYPVPLENFGLMDCQSGTLQLFGGGTLAGQLMAGAGAHLDLVGGAWTQPAPDVPTVSGAGSVRFTAGTLQMLNSIPNLQLAGGVVILLPDFQNGGAITDLTLDGATLSGTNVVTGTLHWRDGTISGVLTIASNALLIAEGTATKTWNAVVTNRGTFQISGGGDVYLFGNNGARMVNEGLFEYLADRYLYGINGNPPFANLGIIRKSGGTGTAGLGVSGSYPITLANVGLIESRSGVLQLFGGGTLAGQLLTSAGARVELVGGTWTQPAPGVPLVGGPGNSRLTGGTLRLLDAIPSFQFTGGFVLPLPDFQAAGVITNLTLQGSTLAGTNSVIGTLVCQAVTGPLAIRAGAAVNWNDGAFAGPVLIESNAVLTLSGSTAKGLNGALTNQGTVQGQPSGPLYLFGANGARVENAGLWDMQGDVNLYGINGNPPFRNLGELRKSAGANSATMGVSGSYPVSFENLGTVTVLSGSLQFFGDGLLTGFYSMLPGARVDFVGGTWTQPPTSSALFTGGGEARFTGGIIRLLDRIPNLRLLGGAAILLPDFQATGAITNLVLEGTTLSGTNLVLGSLNCQAATGPMTIASGAAVTWTDGAWTGPVLIGSNAVLALSGVGIKTLNGALTNLGTVLHQNGGAFYLLGLSGAQVDSAGLWDMQADQNTYGINGNPAFRNLGLLRKSGGTGVGTIGVSGSYPVGFQNLGTVEIVSGTLSFFGTSTLSNGNWRVAMRGLTDYGRINVANPVTLGGTLGTYLVGGYQPIVGNKFTVVTFPAASGAFASLDLPDGIVWQTDYAAANVSLTVLGACTPAPQGLAAWWPAEGTADEAVANRDGILRNGASFAAGRVGQAFSLDGQNDYVEVPDSALWAFGTNDFAASLWANFRNVPASTLGQPAAIFIGQSEGTGNLGKWFFALGGGLLNLHLNGPVLGPRFLAQAAFAPLTNTWYHLAFTRSNGFYRIFTNGVLAASQSEPASIPDLAAPLTIGSAEGLGFMDGFLDEILLVNRALTAGEISGINQAGSLGLCRPTQPPLIVTQPQSRTNAPGTTASFTVSAAGSSPLSYQWRFNGAPLADGGRVSGAQSSFLSVAGVQAGDAGAYSVTVNNPAGSTNSLPAQLAVDGTAPIISQVSTNVGQAQCVISWQTDEPASSVVEYGLTPGYGTTNRLFGNLLTAHTVTLSSLTPGLTYHFRIRSADSVSNEAATADLTFQTLPAPDLAPSIVAATSPIQVGQSFTVWFTITNSGSTAAAGPWQNTLLVANTPDGSGAQNVASTAFNPGPGGLAAGASITLTQTVLFPNLATGTRFVGVSVDSFNQVVEVIETNNTAYLAAPVQVTATDLRVARVSGPPSAAFGQSINVQFVVTNAGSAPAPFAWTDRLYLSSFSNSLSIATLLAATTAPIASLPAGQSYTNSATVELPLSAQSIPGTYFLVLSADHANAIVESSENNNLGAAPLTLTLPPLPDLVVHGVVAPTNALPGQTLPLSWVITNQGSLMATGIWSETVYLATNTAGAGALELGNFTYTNTLLPGGSLARTQAVVLPINSPLGSLWTVVRVDSAGDVTEENETNNVSAAPSPTLIPAVLTLQAGAEQVAEGAPQPVHFTVTRNGSRSGALSVTIATPDDTELLAPTNVVIPAGQASATFDVYGRMDGIVDGPQSAPVVVSAPGFQSASLNLTVLDVDIPRLTLALATNTVLEGHTVSATISRDAGTNNPVTITVASSNPSQLLAPLPFILPAGAGSMTIALLAVDDSLIENVGAYLVTVSAPGYANASANVLVVDDDLPAITFELASSTISEGAGSQATVATITRSIVNARTLELDLESSNTNAARVPAKVVIPGSAASISFPVAAVDNDLVDGPKPVQLRVWIRATGLSTRLAEGPPANLTVTDDDGPTLRLVIDRDVAGEGADPGAYATVSRNTGTNAALVVNVASSDTTELTTPATVTIPAGSNSVTFGMATIDDGVTDGNQVVTVTASAPGYTSGSGQVTVTDVNLPDLIVAAITAPAAAETESFVSIGYQLRNQGVSPASSNAIVQRVYLSPDPLVGDDVLIGQFTFNGGLPAGSQFGQAFSVRMPQAPGDYWVIVQADVDNAVPEILEQNNTRVSSAPIHLVTAYDAEVSTTLETAAAGTPVPFVGRAFHTNGAPAPFALVSIHIYVRDTHRVIAAVADVLGNFTTTWQPLPGEAGSYTVGAAHPGFSDAPAQDSFTLYGIKASPSTLSLTVAELGSVGGVIQLVNQSSLPLTSVQAEILSKPDNLDAAISLQTNSLVGLGTNFLSYGFTARDASIVQGQVQVRVSSSEGAVVNIPIGVRVEALRPRLVATPQQLTMGVKRGGQRLVEFQVANAGGAASGPISVSLPTIPWLSLITPNPLPSLAPGETNSVTLSLTPDDSQPLTVFNGNLALNAVGAGLSVPFAFRVLSEARGDLRVTAVDEFTYYAAGAPRVSNATVVVRDTLSRAVITNGVTDAAGELFVPQLLEGYYDLEVSADRHNSYRNTHLILSGTTNEVSTFISRQTVRYTWTVERIEIEDRYRITIETEFEANVPAPVVTIDPPVISVADLMVVGQVKPVNLTIENHGLIAVDDTRLNFGTHPFYSIEPLIKDLGRLGAKSSLTIPVTLRRIGTFASAGAPFQAASGGGAPCGMGGDLSYDFECGPLKISGGSSIGVDGVQGDCGGGPILGSGGSAGPGSNGGGGGGGGGSGSSVNTGFSSFEIGVKIGCDPTCLVLAGLGCIPGPVGCFFGGVSCGKGLAEDGVQAIDVVDCGVGLAGCLGPPPVAAAACLYSITRCFISPAGGAAAGPEPFLPASAVSTTDPLSAFKPGVRAMLDSFNELTGAPDGVWFNPQANTDMGLWIARFQEAAGPASEGGRTLTPAERASLLVGVQPPGVPVAEISRFLDRWNRSLENWAQGILRPADAPPGANLDFIDVLRLKEKLILAGQYNDQAIAAGFTDPLNAIVETVRFRAAAGEGGGTCARVRLKLDQQAIVSREAFRATLEFDNADASEINGISVELHVTGAGGNDALALFGMAPPVVTGMSDVNGGGSLLAGAQSKAAWTIIPTVDAAPSAPTPYFVSGVLRYRLSGVAVTVPLAPNQITVHPVPRLTVQYFHERDVFSDDPHTDEIEPSIPFNLAVMVLNKGGGVAKNFRITSAQPQIIENEKGLLVDFKIIATEVAGQSLSPSLTANFGNIDPGTNGIARWLMTSTIQGLFINYSATFEHIDGLGNPKLSLIDDVSIHEMNHLVQAGGPFEDGRPDFLVNDQPDLRDYPDTLYLSDGTTNSVEVVTNAVVTGVLSAGNLQVQISAALPGGWAYLRVPDPGNGQYRLTGVRRSDNGLVAVNTNAWVTARTFYGQGTRPVAENILHLLDYNSTGTYTLTYQPISATDTQPPSSAVAALPPSSGAAILLNWAGQDNPGGSGIAFYDVYVSENGGSFQRWLAGTPNSAAVYQGELGKTYAFYSVATDGAGNREPAPPAPDAQTTVTRVNRAPIPGPMPDVTLVERDTLAIDIPATDPDGDALSFSLLPGAPLGMVLDSYTGRLTWITGEGHGPSTNPVTVRVLDSGVPQLSATVSFKVIVLDDNEAPVLAPIEDRITGEGRRLTFAITATDPDLPPQALTYSLGPGAPPGAAIDPATGVFSWQPNDVQGGTTNLITAVVTDNGVPALNATRTFKVIVRDTRADFVVSVGSTNVLAGQGGAVPVTLASSLDLTNLSFVLEADARRLTSFLLTPLAPAISSASLAPAGSNRSELRFLTRAGTPLLGDVLLGRVDFTATPTPVSAVVPIDVLSVTGVRPTGETVHNAGTRPGQVVVIGDEIVLVGLLDPQRRVAIYGRPGLCVQLQSSTNLNASAWRSVGQYALSGQSEFVTLPPENASAVFYRATLCGNSTPILLLRVEPNRSGTLVLSGQPGAHYTIEQKSGLQASAAWGPLTNLTLVTTNASVLGLPLTNTARFFRAVGP